ncbi:MAG: acetyltransferase [Flavobacteriales bacterium]|nr:acetyltransferase [Flavobacteriales bacterium]
MFLYGASGHGKVIEDILSGNGIVTKGFIDDDRLLSRFSDKPVYHSLAESDFNVSVDRLIISVGNNLTRKRLVGQLDVSFGIGIHTSAMLSQSAKVGDGTVVMAHSTVNAGSVVGRHCIINTNASVDHDCVIEDFVHISPNVALAGGVHVGEGTHVGIGACVIQGIRIGKWVIIGAGSVIIQDVPDFAVVVGNPGRVVKFRTDIK